jgi:hypothetical protein
LKNGEITASPAGEAEAGTVVTLTVTSADGYVLKSGSLAVAGNTSTDEVATSSEREGTFTFIMPAEAITVTAEFEEIPPTIPTYTVTIGDYIYNGIISTEKTKYTAGEEVVVTVKPNTELDSRYVLRFLHYTPDGEDMIFIEPSDDFTPVYKFIMPNKPVTLFAVFGIPTYAATVAQNLEHGKLAVGTTGTAAIAFINSFINLKGGDFGVVRVTPDSGYRLKEDSLTYTRASGGEPVKINGKRTLPSEFSFVMPSEPIDITAVFEKIDETDVNITLASGDGGITYKTLAAAVKAAEEIDVITIDGVCTISSTVSIPDGDNITIQGKDADAAIVRAKGFTGALIEVGTSASAASESTAALSLSNITLDGGYLGGQTAMAPLVLLAQYGAPSLTIGDGAALQNNYNAGRSVPYISAIDGGAIGMSRGYAAFFAGIIPAITMSGGKISGNYAYTGGGINLNFAGFEMTGGEISGNTALIRDDNTFGLGGGLYIGLGSTANIYGGEITGNSAEGYGDAVYAGDDSNQITTLGVNGGTLIDGNIGLHGAKNSRVIKVLSPLTNPLSIEIPEGSPKENVLIAQGRDYTLTESDLEKFLWSGDGAWHFGLSEGDSKIYLTEGEWGTAHSISWQEDYPYGSVTVDKTSAAPGEIVTVTAVPSEEYMLSDGGLKYTNQDGDAIAVTGAGDLPNTYTFAMPNKDTQISAVFAPIPV